jgi:dephospho-CoA kinase
MYRIGLTGGIASGKSTVADMFAALGATIIDTDVIAHDLVQPGTPALQEIRGRFGDKVIDKDGSLKRAALRKRVFEDDASRAALEQILHPRIREETLRRSAAAQGDYQLIVVPLLVESPLRQFVNRVLVVDCDPETQLARLLDRDAESVDQARRIIAAQASRESRLEIADDVVSNDGDLDKTRMQVDALHRRYLKEASGRSGIL